MRVVMIGSGNVATTLCKIIFKAGHQIVQVLGRNDNNAKMLAQVYGCEWGNFKSTTYLEGDIYILAINDNSLAHLDNYPSMGKKLVVHTAGSVVMDVLAPLSKNYGVLYPLQSLNKHNEVAGDIPFLVNGNSAEVISSITSFGKTLSNNVSYVTDEQRLKYHVAAVIVNNFTNHLYALAKDFCDKEEIDFEKLFPLINETTNRIKGKSPKELQTGPALREDIYTMGKHLKLLTKHEEIKYLYLKLSESILKFHKEE